MTGQDFRKLRDALGLSAAQLADELGVDEETIDTWERGEQDIPNMAIFVTLCLAEDAGLGLKIRLDNETQ